MKNLIKDIRARLRIDDARDVEIESKKRVRPEEAKRLRKFLIRNKKARHEKTTIFFDQFLDTPRLDLLRLGASLRIRYKGGGARVYLQYKGPGFLKDGILFRSEYSSGRLRGVLLEESRHDVIRFSSASIRRILKRRVPAPMARAMRRHLGERVVSRISTGPVISIYRKEKFRVRLNGVFLEPSLDRIFAFHISRTGLHPLSTFWELENEIKSETRSLTRKVAHLPKMKKWDEMLAKKFDLQPEPLDKYHRTSAIFSPPARRRASRTTFPPRLPRPHHPPRR